MMMMNIPKGYTRIVYPELLYNEALANSNLMPLCERRDHFRITLFNRIIGSDGQHKLARLLPARNDTRYRLRNKRMFSLVILRPKGFKILL